MKFNELLNRAAAVIPAYRQIVFKTIIIAFCAGGSPGRISNVFRKFELLLTGDATLKKFYNFLNSGKLPWDALWGFLAGIMGDPTVAGRLLIALDDTTYGKAGKEIAGCDSHFDHAAKQNSSKWIFGHCRVLAGLLLFGHGRWACLPFTQKLYLPLPKTVKSSAKLPHAEWLKTKSGIGAELVIRLALRFKRPVLIVCDSWFGTKPLLEEVRAKIAFAVHILSRLRISAILYEMPEFVPGKRGRRPRFGRQLAPVKVLSAQLRQSARSAMIHIYGKNRKVEFAELICMSKAFGCQVKVVFVYYKGFAFPLITTDLTLTAEQMIEFYSARWKIESGFKEIKQDIGAIDSQCRKPLAVENHFDLCCFAMSLTRIYAFKLDHAPNRRHPGKRTGTFAFADIAGKSPANLPGSPFFSGDAPKDSSPPLNSSAHQFSAGLHELKFQFSGKLQFKRIA